MRHQRTEQGLKTFLVTADEYGSSKRHSKLSHALHEKRLDKFNPPKGLVATTVSATREVRVFTVVNNRPHKLLAWRRSSADRKNEWVIVANRDEPTYNNMLLIYVRALLRKARALQLSRLSTFLGSAQQRRNPASVATKGFA
jgi:hypothetical protein